MILELFDELLVGIVQAAIEEATFATIIHSGEPARYLVLCIDAGVTLGFYAAQDDVFRIDRRHRLLIEPLNQVVLRPIDTVTKRWEVT